MTDSWRFIDTGPCGAAFNMALDETLAISVREDTSPPVLRLYGWEVPSVSIGCFQKIGEVDVEHCLRSNIPIVRRPTGGRGILHGDEITYSFAVKTSTGPFSKGLFDSYKKISLALGEALIKTGVTPELKLLKDNRGTERSDMQNSPLCFQSVSYGEISVNSGKIIGSAQKRWQDGLLQQGAIPLLADRENTSRVFRMSSHRGPDSPLCGLKDLVPGLDPSRLKDAIRSSFEEIFDVSFIISAPSKEEVSLARELESQKYSSRLWTFNR